MKRLRFVMLGGFLGAGKTTTLARLARLYQCRGQRVGLVTNDQAQDLVDTSSLRSQGFAVEEVPGACFCCRFDDLVGRVGRLEDRERPDVILAEPVGSCTDLVATVVQPMKDLYGERFTVAPYAVLFKPSHGLRILKGDKGSGFSPKAAYIFRKQLEEADAIVVNRIDEMSTDAIAETAARVSDAFPGMPVLKMSARTGLGVDALVELLDEDGSFGRKILNIDYDVYAEGEAELGWVNASARVAGPKPFAVDPLLLEVVSVLKETLARAGGEVAHLKAIGLSEGAFGVANLVASTALPDLSLPARSEERELDLIVNARVALDPARIAEEVRRAVTAATTVRGATATFHTVQSFRPGRPQPTHRYAAAK